jgi:ornithine cyclodeaminase
VKDADIVVCATTSSEPILTAEMLTPGAFIAAVGANRVTARELDEEVVGRADMIVVDDVTQAMTEAAELIFAAERRRFFWERAIPLAQIVVGNVSPRTAPIHWTLFKSLGIALEDVAAANAVYEKALAQGVGKELPTGGLTPNT